MFKSVGKGKCPHPYTKNGRRYIAYSLDGEIVRLDVESGVRKKLCYGDEYVYIGNGKAIVRDGQNIFQTEEEE